MMIKEKTNPWARLKYAYVLPLAAIAVTAFARPEFSNKMEEISAVKVNDLKEIVETKVPENQSTSLVLVQEKPPVAVSDTAKKKKTEEEPVFTMVEEIPEYPGGLKACMEFLNSNVKYPETASKANIQGRVIVQFVVEKDGSIIEQNVVHSVEPSLDAEALRVVGLMPKWKPGKHKGQNVRVKFTMPIMFNLNGGKAKKGDAVEVRMTDDNPPLIIMNGKEIDKAVLQAIDPNKIESISVLKDKSATEVYGEKGKNGVILVTLKVPLPSSASKAEALKVVGYGKYSPELIKTIGTVKDESGKPVIGANVLIEGAAAGTITDADGRFILNAPKDKMIAVSYIGMKTVKVSPAVEVTVKMVKE